MHRRARQGASGQPAHARSAAVHADAARDRRRPKSRRGGTGDQPARAQRGAARGALNIEFGRLQLEQATWAESNRIDQVARTRLGMVFPETREIVVVRP